MKKMLDTFLFGFFSFALPFAYLLNNESNLDTPSIGQYFKQVGDYICKGMDNYGKNVTA